MPDPLTSDFFISGNVTPAGIAALISPRWYECSRLTKVSRAEGSDLLVRPRFLPTELVAREAQNDKTLVFVLLVEGLQAFVLGCEAAGEMDQSVTLAYKGSCAPLRSYVDDKDSLAFQLRKEVLVAIGEFGLALQYMSTTILLAQD